jgi:o-succinylbenzoate synthase
MKIVGGEAIPIRIALKKPFKIAVGALTHSNHVLVRLADDEGRTGWGETTTFLEVYGYDQRSLYHTLTDYLIPGVIGLNAGDLAGIHRRMDQLVPFNWMAKAAIDLAAHDLAAQAAEVPLHAMLGARRSDRVPLIGVVDVVMPEEAAQSAARQVSLGFHTIKIKVGLEAETDIRRVKAVREAVGSALRLRVDGNCGYDRDTAWAVFSRMEDYALEWIEQPLPAWDLEGMAELARRLKTPVAADESVYTIHDAQRCIAMRAADVINIKLPKCGGIFRCRQIVGLCHELDTPCFLGGCLETTPGMAAAMHFYAATPGVVSAAEILGHSFYEDDVVHRSIDVVDGAVELPRSPGLGVSIDEGKVARYRRGK